MPPSILSSQVDVRVSLSAVRDRKSTRLNSSHVRISYAVFCVKKKRAAAIELPYGRKRALELDTTLALHPEMLLHDDPTACIAHDDIDRISTLIYFFFNDPATPEIYTIPLHDALPI